MATTPAPVVPETPAPDPPPVPVLPHRSCELCTSYELQASELLTNWPPWINPDTEYTCADPAVAYGDFDQDGDEDVFVAVLSVDRETPLWPAQMHPTPVRMFLNEGEAGFQESVAIFSGPMPGAVHPRKSITGDFNADGRLDILVADHGYDFEPWPGAPPLLLLSTDRGLQAAPGLEDVVAYHHGAASGDIDNDGDLDIVLTGGPEPPAMSVLRNDGRGGMTYTTEPLPDELLAGYLGGFLTVELIHLDADPYVDLLATGFENLSRGTRIYWGDRSGIYSVDRKTVIPELEGWEIVNDIDAEDLDGDGLRDLILNRAMLEPFYQGYSIQVLRGTGDRQFEDATAAMLREGTDRDANWLEWIRVVDLNNDGALDLFVDDCSDHGLHWLNNGSGRLAPGPPIS